jgi:hypothetical protein
MKRGARIDWDAVVDDDGVVAGPADPGTTPDHRWCTVRRDGEDDWLLDFCSDLPGQWLLEVYEADGIYSIDGGAGRRVRHADLAAKATQHWVVAGEQLSNSLINAALDEEDLIGVTLCMDAERCVWLLTAAEVDAAHVPTLRAASRAVHRSSGPNRRAALRAAVLCASSENGPNGRGIAVTGEQLAAWDEKEGWLTGEQASCALRARMAPAEVTRESDWQTIRTLAAMRQTNPISL